MNIVQAASMKSHEYTRPLPQRRDTHCTLEVSWEHVAPCGSLIWLEFSGGGRVMMRNDSELVHGNQIMQRALSHQKESELLSDRDGVPIEGLHQRGDAILPFL